MTEFPPPFHGPRDPGDAWVEGPDGTRMWGRFGSAGLLAVDRERGILLQHRAQWSHYGGTWGIPGGARHQDELAVDAALREANEEADVPIDALAPLFTSVLDLGFWTYTTAAARTVRPFEPAITDAESLALAWVPLHEVDDLPLHPHFGDAWPRLRTLLEHPPLLLVDAANVVGSRPDGWWKDRAGATRRLLAALRAALEPGFPADLLAVPAGTVWPRTVVVLEGAAKDAAAEGPYKYDGGAAPARGDGTVGPVPEDDGEDAPAPNGGTSRPVPEDDGGAGQTSAAHRRGVQLEVAHAAGSGDDEIVAQVEKAFGADSKASVTVVTSDRALRERIESLGARAVGAGTLLELLG